MRMACTAAMLDNIMGHAWDTKKSAGRYRNPPSQIADHSGKTPLHAMRSAIAWSCFCLQCRQTLLRTLETPTEQSYNIVCRYRASADFYSRDHELLQQRRGWKQVRRHTFIVS